MLCYFRDFVAFFTQYKMSYVRYLRSSESRHYCKKKTHITTASLNLRIPREWNCAIFIFNLQYIIQETSQQSHNTQQWAEENKPKTWIIWRCVDLFFIISWSLSCGRSLDESLPPSSSFFFHLIFSFFSILVVEVAQRPQHPSCQPQQQSKRRKSNFLRIFSLTRCFFSLSTMVIFSLNFDPMQLSRLAVCCSAAWSNEPKRSEGKNSADSTPMTLMMIAIVWRRKYGVEEASTARFHSRFLSIKTLRSSLHYYETISYIFTRLLLASIRPLLAAILLPSHLRSQKKMFISTIN